LYPQFHHSRASGYRIQCHSAKRSYPPIKSPDSKVLGTAQELDAILLSLNGDFANILSYPPDRYKGIIAFQVRNHPETIPHLMRRLLSYLALHPEMDFYKGKLILLEVHRIRIQK
jgi:hypothetical protein